MRVAPILRSRSSALLPVTSSGSGFGSGSLSLSRFDCSGKIKRRSSPMHQLLKAVLVVAAFGLLGGGSYVVVQRSGGGFHAAVAGAVGVTHHPHRSMKKEHASPDEAGGGSGGLGWHAADAVHDGGLHLEVGQDEHVHSPGLHSPDEHKAAQHAQQQQQAQQQHEQQQQQAAPQAQHQPSRRDGVDHHAAAARAPQQPSLYDASLEAVDIYGNLVHVSDLRGKAVVFVNVASKCGYTEANYQGLQGVYERYHDHGLEILAFPSNQFGGQEPGTNTEIEQFARTQYGVTFSMMAKCEVNGMEQQPIFQWLKEHAPAAPGGAPGADISWNFNKFLVDKWGVPVKRYGPDFVYKDIELDIYNELIRAYP
eukprot:scaffold4.g4959.t1